MKKLEKTLLIVFILLFFYLTRNINIFPLTISFSMYILFSSIFSTTSIKDVISDYHNKKYYYTRDKIFKYSVITIILLGIFLTIVSYLIGNILDIDKVNIINIYMSISLIVNILLKIISEYLDIIGYKKLSNKLIDIYNIIILVVSMILSILLFKVFKLDIYMNIILLYSVNIIVFIMVIILLFLLVFNKKKKYNKKDEINKLTYINNIKYIIVNDMTITIFNVIKSTYNYISVIVLYYILINKYNYSYEVTVMFITNTYFYGIIIIYFIYKYINKYLDIDYNSVINKFNNNINNVIRISLNICILLFIISMPINNMLFNIDYNILFNLIPLLFFYILYDFIMGICIKYNKNKNSIGALLIGLIIKIIFELPLINAVYRMGYFLTLGSILSSVLGFSISIVLGIIFIKHKYKINILDNFNNILNIIYESIIYALVLVLFTLIIKIDTNGIIDSILVVIFYIFITIIFYIIKRILTRK